MEKLLVLERAATKRVSVKKEKLINRRVEASYSQHSIFQSLAVGRSAEFRMINPYKPP